MASSTVGEVGSAVIAAMDFMNPATLTQSITTSALTSASGTSAPSGSGSSSSRGWLSWLFGGLTGVSDFLPNAGLVLLGVVLGVGALLISQKQTVVQVAKTVGEEAGI
jgi:hypothetical protein